MFDFHSEPNPLIEKGSETEPFSFRVPPNLSRIRIPFPLTAGPKNLWETVRVFSNLFRRNAVFFKERFERKRSRKRTRRRRVERRRLFLGRNEASFRRRISSSEETSVSGFSFRRRYRNRGFYRNANTRIRRA